MTKDDRIITFLELNEDKARPLELVAYVQSLGYSRLQAIELYRKATRGWHIPGRDREDRDDGGQY